MKITSPQLCQQTTPSVDQGIVRSIGDPINQNEPNRQKEATPRSSNRSRNRRRYRQIGRRNPKVEHASANGVNPTERNSAHWPSGPVSDRAKDDDVIKAPTVPHPRLRVPFLTKRQKNAPPESCNDGKIRPSNVDGESLSSRNHRRYDRRHLAALPRRRLSITGTCSA